MHSHQRPTTGRLIQNFVSIVGFTLLTAWVLVAANGYAINLQSGSVRQTTAIVLAGSPAEASVVLDQSEVGSRLPLTLRNLDAGRHSVRVSARNYSDWQRSVTLAPGAAARFDRIVLFAVTPRLLATQTLTDRTVAEPIDPTLEVIGGELYRLEQGQPRLVTRFSQPILAARAAPDHAHLFVQLGAALYVTELDGANTVKLVDLPDRTPATITVNESLTELTALQGSQHQRWQIR